MARRSSGDRTVQYLLDRGRLERIEVDDAVATATMLVDRASRRLLTAGAGATAGDLDGAYAVAYDAYRMAAEALLVRQALRATGGEGSHVTVEDAVSAQSADAIAQFAKPTFERFRRTRHQAQYFDPNAAPIDPSDVEWALSTARRAVGAVRAVLQGG